MPLSSTASRHCITVPWTHPPYQYTENTSTWAMATPTRTVLGPLTTVFTAPTHCNNPLLQINILGNRGYLSKRCQEENNRDQLYDDESCWPPVSSALSTSPFNGLGVYSPGMFFTTLSTGQSTWLPACPLSHTTACGTTSGGVGDFTFQLPLLKSETAVGCCPSLYTCTSSMVSP